MKADNPDNFQIRVRVISKNFFAENKERRKMNIVVGLIKCHENGSRK